MSPTRRAAVFLAAAFASVTLLMGCDGKPCQEVPDYSEEDEETREEIVDLLEEADVYDAQQQRILELNEKLDDDRTVFRKRYERIRVKLIDGLVAMEPKPENFKSNVDALHGVFMKYAHEAVGLALKAHRMLTTEQRQAIAEEWDDDPEDYDGSWAVDRGIDLALLKIDATDPQKELVWEWRDRMVEATDELYKDQNKLRKKLLVHWRSKKPDRKLVRKYVDEAGGQIKDFIHLFADGAFEITEELTPEQRMWTNKQVNKMRRCPQ
jgi:Spy/CpxP family protein refolding chaperone